MGHTPLTVTTTRAPADAKNRDAPPLLQIFFVEYWMDGIPHWRLLLSGPESREVVLVSAAHCNFVCKVMILPGVTSERGLASEILFTGLRIKLWDLKDWNQFLSPGLRYREYPGGVLLSGSFP